MCDDGQWLAAPFSLKGRANWRRDYKLPTAHKNSARNIAFQATAPRAENLDSHRRVYVTAEPSLRYGYYDSQRSPLFKSGVLSVLTTFQFCPMCLAIASGLG